MSRLKIGVLAGGVLASMVLVVGAVSAGAESGPKCADIGDPVTLQGQTHFYRGTGTAQNQPPYTFGMELILAAPACKSVVYTVYIIQDLGATGAAGAPTPVLQTGASATGNPQFTTTVNDDDPTICVYATTASKGGHVFDRAPDIGCLEITAPASGGGSGFS
ncbi:MAG: hypothetical protein M3546_06535 [Actinomycetota bacterium]|nr:hypothetical protein [Actinomycetota bacterium]